MDVLDNYTNECTKYHSHRYYAMIEGVDFWWAKDPETWRSHFVSGHYNCKTVTYIGPGVFEIEIENTQIPDIIDTGFIDIEVRPDNDCYWVYMDFKVIQVRRETVSNLIIEVK